MSCSNCYCVTCFDRSCPTWGKRCHHYCGFPVTSCPDYQPGAVDLDPRRPTKQIQTNLFGLPPQNQTQTQETLLDLENPEKAYKL